MGKILLRFLALVVCLAFCSVLLAQDQEETLPATLPSSPEIPETPANDLRPLVLRQADALEKWSAWSLKVEKWYSEAASLYEKALTLYEKEKTSVASLKSSSTKQEAIEAEKDEAQDAEIAYWKDRALKAEGNNWLIGILSGLFGGGVGYGAGKLLP